jgi:hypothetical protein
VKKDFLDNHGRAVQRKTLQSISEVVGILALAKESTWEYVPTPEDLEDKAKIISIGLDGTCMQMREDGWREAMTGTVTLYNKDGDRLHTTYVAASPEYGKETFLNKLENVINKTKKTFSTDIIVGLADGARDNWLFLGEHTDYQVLDFYHVTEYLGAYSRVVIKDHDEQKIWLENACHNLKHKVGAAARPLSEFENEAIKKHKKETQEIIVKTVTYFKNNLLKMKYSKMMEMNAPIGSGVTEAACKVIVKERMCKSGMRWNEEGAHIVLKLRSMNQTQGNWDFFWNMVDKNGVDLAA